MDIAVVGAASWVQLDPAGETIEEARVGAGRGRPDAGPRRRGGPWLAGKPATEETFARAGELARAAAIADQRHARHRRVSHAPGRRPRPAHAGQGGRAGPGLTEPARAGVAFARPGIQGETRVQENPRHATINGEPVEFLCEPRQSLLEVLRDTLRLTGAKEGCNNGNCGACTVMMNGVPVNSCLVLAVEAEGATIETVEGLAQPRAPAPAAAVLPGRGRPPVRRLHARLPRRRQGPARQEPRTPPSTRSASTWPTTSAAAPATTRSSGPSRPPRATCRGVTAANARPRNGRPRSTAMAHANDLYLGKAEYQVLGRRPVRHDGADKVTGQGDLYGRRPAAEPGARRDRPQPARPCADQVDRRDGGPRGARRVRRRHGATTSPTSPTSSP